MYDIHQNDKWLVVMAKDYVGEAKYYMPKPNTEKAKPKTKNVKAKNAR
jgi:hypothetical protein